MNKESRRCLPAHMTEAEINELFASCLPRLKKSARKMLNNREDSEDSLQDGMLLAFRRLLQFEGRASFATWLHSIVRNTSRGNYRKGVSRQTVSLDPLVSEEAVTWRAEFVEPGLSPEEICIRKERSDILRMLSRRIRRAHLTGKFGTTSRYRGMLAARAERPAA